MKFKRVLLTGAGGFIGSHLTEELISRGYQVTALVHYNSLNRWGWLESLPDDMLKMVDVCPGDIRDPHSVKHSMRSADAVIHLAALIGIPYSYHSPDSYVETNIRGTLNVLQAARELNVQQVLQTSTSEVYGTAQFVPITELHPLSPQSPYAATKVGADVLALSFCKSFELPITVVRPFNTYGPRQSARAIIPTIITQLLSGEATLKLGDLFPTRDLTYVEDIVKGFVLALECECAFGEVVNLGNNHEISIGDLAIKIATLLRKDISLMSEANRIRPEKSEVRRLCACNRKAKDLLKWEPSVNLDEGISRTIEWFQSSGNLPQYKSSIYNL